MANPTPEQQKAWRQANKERVRQYANEYRSKPEVRQRTRDLQNAKYHAELKHSEEYRRKAAESQKRVRAKNPEATKASDREKTNRFRAKNREALNAKQKAIYQSLTEEQRKAISAERREYLKQYRQANAERLAEWARANYESNKDSIAIDAKVYYEENRHAFIARAEERQRQLSQRGKYTKEDVQALYEKQRGLCAACKLPIENTRSRSAKRGFEVDHVMPVSKGGMNTVDNLALLHVACNRKKHAKHPDRWAAELGKLFV